MDRFVVGGTTVVAVGRGRAVTIVVVAPMCVVGGAIDSVEAGALAAFVVGVELELVRAEPPPLAAVEIAAAATTPIRTARPICPRRGHARTCRKIVCTRYAERERGRVYGVPFVEWSEQIIAVPANVTPVAPTGEQNEPGYTAFDAGGEVTDGAFLTAVGPTLLGDSNERQHEAFSLRRTTHPNSACPTR